VFLNDLRNKIRRLREVGTCPKIWKWICLEPESHPSFTEI
jgi:hypothetical protein